MTISIILPLYNVERYITRCLRSITSQSYSGDVECIIVDDSSEDSSLMLTAEIVNSYRGAIEFRFIYHSHNRGLSAARNSGIAAAKGDYILFVDSDDEIPPHSIENLANLVERYPKVDIVKGCTIKITDSQREEFSPPYTFGEFSDDKEWIYNAHFSTSKILYTVWNTLIRRGLISDNELLFKEGVIHEDILWSISSAPYIGSIAFCKSPTYYYHTVENSIITTPFKDLSAISYLSMLEEIVASSKFSRPHKLDMLYIILSGVICHRKTFATLPLRAPAEYLRIYRETMSRIAHSRDVELRFRIGCRYLLLPTWAIKKRVVCGLFGCRARGDK